MTKDEALDLALEALESCDFTYTFGNGGYQQFDRALVDTAITAIKQALAAQHEPENEPFVSLASVQDVSLIGEGKTAAQRQWVGLTDEEIEQGCKESWVTEQAFQSAVWWAEAKLKEKNT